MADDTTPHLAGSHAAPTLARAPSAVTRRGFLKSAAFGALTCAASPVLANFVERRSLSFVHTHTGEELSAEYFRDGAYDQAALLRVAHTLRDFRSGDVHAIDPMLLDSLFELQVVAGHDKPYQIISAYRSPQTNKGLRNKSQGVAERSLHLKGQAVDIRVSGVSTKKLRDLALAMNRGGVGYYHSSDFLHVDTGRVRSW
jgi:uncharacterized protein YcbK (DUF882 family)